MALAGPTIVTHATDEQKQRLLRPMFTGEEIWCQLFSEPGAGSDFAGLACRAVRDGDEWIVNGQKVWNTLAHLGDRGMLVTRTDPDAPKHKGMTYFAVDMHAPGVEVRPLRQITGEAEFNEVYLTDVRIADADRIGAVGEGWRVALTTLMNERTAIGGSAGTDAPRRGGQALDAVKIWKDLPSDERTAVRRDRLAQLWIRGEIQRLTNKRAVREDEGGQPRSGGLGRQARACGAEQGALRVLHRSPRHGRPGRLRLLVPSCRRARSSTGGARGPRYAFLRVRANSIEGGTSEIMRNILGEQVLGLPGEPRVDKDVPWSTVPRS